MLCRLFLRVFLRHVVPHDAAAYSAGDCAMPSVMGGNCAYRCAFQAAGGVGSSDCRQRQRDGKHEESLSVQFILQSFVCLGSLTWWH